MSDRRNFIKQLSSAGLLTCIPDLLVPGPVNFKTNPDKANNDKIWGCLLHLSTNMWLDYMPKDNPDTGFDPVLRFDEEVWNASVNKMAEQGLNLVVIDIGDGILYESHPEISVSNAWPQQKIRDELKRLRQKGIEPIPKLNFSTCHDAWMGVYSRMVSTKKYYEVCGDLIREVCEIFDTPRFFHLGMDEENAANQRNYNYAVVRQRDLWWGDFYFLIGEVEKNGSRPWIWSDYLWNNPEDFFRNMPKSVIQGNWYYEESFDVKTAGKDEIKALKAYEDLEKHGYDQIPTGSNYFNHDGNMAGTIKYCKKNIADERLLGFLQTPWKMTLERYRADILKSIEQLGNAKKWFFQAYQ
jgi:hypothetical protein